MSEATMENIPSHMAEVLVWRKGAPNPLRLYVSNDEAKAFVTRIREEGLSVEETYFLDTQIDASGRKTFMALSNVDALLANVSTGIVPARGSGLVS